MYEFTIYQIPFVVSAVIIAYLAMYALIHRQQPVAMSFAGAMLAILIWVVSDVFEYPAVGLDLKLFWANIGFLGLTMFPVFWLIMTLDYLGNDERYRWRIFWISSVVPALTLLVIWTNDWHHLWRGDSWLETNAAPIPVVIYDYQIWFYAVHVVYGQILIFASLVLMARAWRGKDAIYKQQIIILVLATLIPLVTDITYILGFSPLPNINLTPVVFSVSGVLIAWNLFQFQFLSLMPIARGAVVESMDDIVIVLDMEDQIVDVNVAARAIVPDQAQQIIGKKLIEVFPNQRELIEQYTGTDNLRTQVMIETIMLGIRWYDLHIASVFRRNGKQAGRYVVLHDITDKKMAEQERERLIIELDAFAHTVAHDLKNPLSTIGGFARLIANEKMDKSLGADKIIAYSKKMNSIIDELLLMASLRHVDEIELHPVDMAQVVADAQSRLLTLIEKTNAEIIEPIVWHDTISYAPWLEEVWVNYLSNALKYGGNPPQIKLGSDITANGTIRYWVQDNGSGISLEQKGLLFAPFVRKNTSVDGYGLGLSIVQRIIEKLDGEVGVESTPEHGSLFWFTLSNAFD